LWINFLNIVYLGMSVFKFFLKTYYIYNTLIQANKTTRLLTNMRLMKRLFTFLCILFYFSTTAQETEEFRKKFDSIRFDAIVNVSAKDFDKAIQIADSLYSISTTKKYKANALMLSSELHQRKGQRKQAIIYAQQAGEMISGEKFYVLEAQIYGFLSGQYRILGLIEEGRIYLEKALKASNNVNDDDRKNTLLGLAYQEKALYESAAENYSEAKNFASESEKYLSKATDGPRKDFFLGTNAELYGKTLRKLKQYDEATIHYNRALKLLSNAVEPNAGIIGDIYHGLGYIYLEEKEYDLAKEYLIKAEEIAENSDYIGLKTNVYETLSDYYKAVNNHEKSSLYKDKYIEVFNFYEQDKKAAIEDFVKFLKEENQNLFDYRNMLLGLSITLVLLITALIIAYNRKKKRDLQRFNEVLSELKQKIALQEQQVDILIQERKNEVQNSENKSSKSKELQISKDTEIRIIEGLKEFEQSNGFLQNSFSLANLASVLGTNTKYLTFILNKYYQKDFSTYINELRIDYIIQKIETNKEYRSYKFSYLAEECGFSSHSKFSSIFKSVTGFSPSTFIEYLEKQAVASNG
jgi:AraC-like DNA-binding protein